jgi:hypothetical protein
MVYPIHLFSKPAQDQAKYQVYQQMRTRFGFGLEELPDVTGIGISYGAVLLRQHERITLILLSSQPSWKEASKAVLS